MHERTHLPPNSIEVHRDLRIPIAGGSLSADLFLPVTETRVPALLTVLPYRKDALAGIQADADFRWFAAHGYATLLVDFRGTGSSDGAQRPPFDPAEADDAIAAIEWAAVQRWSNGSIGMWGHSYGAILSMRTASRQPRHLKAILPIQGMTDPELDFVHPDGAKGCFTSLGNWATQTLLNQMLPPLNDYGDPAEQERWMRRLHQVEPWLLDFWRHGPGDPVWRTRAIDVSTISVPTFCIAGWRDLFCDSSLRAYERIKAPKKLLVGPWMHTVPNASPFDALDYRLLAVRWWDHWLKGLDTGFLEEPEASIYVQGAARHWRKYAKWPLDADDRQFELRPESKDRPRHAQHRPDPTIGALSGLVGGASSGFGLPLDQRDDDDRAVSLTSEAVTTELAIAGRPQVSIRLQSEAAVERIVVRLCDVDPDGRSALITQGVVVSPDIGAGMLTIGLYATSYSVARGHRLRVAISNADFPRLWPARDSVMPRIDGVMLAVPVLSASAGTGVELPVVKPGEYSTGDLALAHQPSWTIARDMINDGCEVTVGESITSWTPNRRHLLEFGYVLNARVCAGAPSAATARVTTRALLKLDTGQSISVTAESIMNSVAAAVTARVEIDGQSFFSRKWETGGHG